MASIDAQAAISALLPTVEEQSYKDDKELTTFAWCVKYDAMTPARAELRRLDQSVIEGVLALFDVYGIIMPSVQPHETTGAETGRGWCQVSSPHRGLFSRNVEREVLVAQVLAPELAGGLKQDADPNVMLLPVRMLGLQLSEDCGGASTRISALHDLMMGILL